MTASINANTTSGMVVTSDTSGALALQTAGTTALMVTSAQLVGIGTSSPTQKLTVSGGIASIAGISALSASSVFFDYNSGNGRFAAVGSTTGTPAPITLSQYSSNGSVGRDTVTIDTAGNFDLSTGGAVLSLNRGAYSQQTKFYQDTANGAGAQYETTNPTVNVGYYSHVFKGTNNVPTTVEYGRFNQFGLGLGGANPSSGTGIAFPATQSASSDANTLDDYEEGTFTPTVSGAGSVTYSGQYGIYTKIGTMVFVTGKINVASSTLNANIITINGLPFTAINSQDTGQRSSTMIYGDWQNMGSYATTGRLRIDGASIIGVRDSGGSSVYWYYNDLGATGWKFNFCLTYITS